MRYLTILPIVHTDVEMGSVAPELKKHFIRKLGLVEWKRHMAAVKHFWNSVERELLSAEIEWDKIRIYQDGLPIGMDVGQMVADMVERGSRNYQLISRLVDRGATLMETEDPKLLKEEYDQIKSAGNPSEVDSPQLLVRRDKFIAQRIANTLPPDAEALLFIGAKHDVSGHLPQDFEVKSLAK